MPYERSIDEHLRELIGSKPCIFAVDDLWALVPDLSRSALNSLLYRLCRNGYLVRLAKGLYLRAPLNARGGNLLFKAAAMFRHSHFNYLSLESVLSRAGIISQLPMQWISLMTTGRNCTLKIPSLGTIEYIHTKRDPKQLLPELSYDPALGLWTASPKLAMEDMKHSRRDLSLTGEHESI